MHAICYNGCKLQMNVAWDVANHLDAQGRLRQTAHSWKFNMLIAEYKTAHPLTEVDDIK